MTTIVLVDMANAKLMTENRVNLGLIGAAGFNLVRNQTPRMKITLGARRSTGLYIGSAADVSPLIKAATVETFQNKMKTRIESLGVKTTVWVDKANKKFG